MSSSQPTASHQVCSCKCAADVLMLKKRIVELTEEVDDLRRDKRSFRESNDELRTLRAFLPTRIEDSMNISTNKDLNTIDAEFL